MSPLRPVLDSNVLVSALVFPAGKLPWIRRAWQAGIIRPLTSHDTTAELIRVLSYPKFRLTRDEQEALLGDYLPWCDTVLVLSPPKVPACRDPSDLPFLELALAAEADALVTGDPDLLELAEVFSVPILTPSLFQACLRDE